MLIMIFHNCSTVLMSTIYKARVLNVLALQASQQCIILNAISLSALLFTL
jgi:hypothetical protein